MFDLMKRTRLLVVDQELGARRVELSVRLNYSKWHLEFESFEGFVIG